MIITYRSDAAVNKYNSILIGTLQILKKDGAKMIFFISNCGLIFRTEDCLVMVDGLVRDDNLFTTHDTGMQEHVKSVFKGFDGMRVLAFTHCHNDHFDDTTTEEYIKTGVADRLLLPRDRDNAVGCMKMAEVDANIDIVTEDIRVFSFKSLNITYIKTEHVPFDGYECENHYSIIIEMGGRKCLMLSDTNPGDIERVSEVVGSEMNVVFITPVLLGKKKWLKSIVDNFPVADYYVYHLPDPEIDQYGYRKLGIDKRRQCMDIIPNLKLLLTKMRYI